MTHPAWSLLDRAALEAIARRGPTPVFATVSGAHLYGFASPDSDVDLRGAYLLPVRAFLGLQAPQETLAIEERETFELDWVAHDLRKFVRMLTQHNGYVLEQLYSPLVVIETPAFLELRELARACITRPTVRHYQGFASSRRKRLREPAPTVKHLLYAYRVLLSGIHLMRSGEVLADVNELNRAFRSAAIDELVARKSAGAEQLLLREGELALHERALDALEAELKRAHAASSLPDEVDDLEALEDFVVRARLAAEPRS